MMTLKYFSSLLILCWAMVTGPSVLAQQGSAGGARLTAAERAQMQVDRYTKQLDLTPDQTEKIKAIVLASAQEMDQLRAAGSSPDRAAMQSEALKRADEIKALLTPVQQQKFEQLLSQQLERSQTRGQSQRQQRQPRRANTQGKQ